MAELGPPILLIDDEDASRYWQRRILERAGFQVLEARSGEAGLELAWQVQPDLVLLDVQLPDLTGHAVCARLKALPAVAPPLVLMYSAAFTRTADRVEGLQGGADAYLITPVEPEELVAHVRALLRIRHSEQRARLLALRADLATALARKRLPADALQEGAELLVRYLDAEQARVWTVDSDGYFCLQASAGLHGHRDAEQQRLPQPLLLPPEAGWAPRISDRVQTETAIIDGEWAAREGLHAYAGYPLYAEEQLLGYVALLARRPLSPSDREGFLTVAESLSRHLERSAGEARLRQTHDLLSALFQASPLAIFSLTAKGTVRLWNRAAQKLFGWSAAEIEGQSLPLFSGAEAETFAACLAEASACGAVSGLELPAHRKDGTQVTISLSLTSLAAEPQSRVGEETGETGETAELGDTGDILCLATDLTEQVWLESTLHLRERAIEAIGQGILITDARREDHPIIYVNRAFSAQTGYDRWEVLGRNPRFLQGPETDPQACRLLREAVRERQAVSTDILNYRRNGTAYWARLSIAPVLSATGHLTHFVGVHEDISARRSAEAALRCSEERYRELFDNANDVVYSHDLDGRFTDWNRKGEELTGFTRAEILTMSADQLIAPEYLAVAREMTRRKLVGSGGQKGGQTTYEVEVVCRDGTRLPLEVSSRLIYEQEQVVGVTGTARDVRERHSLQSQLLQAQKMEAVGRLAGGVAHDFNNMLAVINGYSSLIADRLPHDHLAREGMLEIGRAGERAAGLTRQLLAFSRKQLLQPRLLSVRDLLVGIESMLRRLIGEDIELHTCLAPDVGEIRADPGQIEQVLLNLVVNSRDALPNGGRITLGARNLRLHDERSPGEIQLPRGSYVEVWVEDTGIGMPPEVLEHIWEPFFTTKELGRGTGLGLSTVYGIVRQSGGYITVESAPGRGSTFRLWFPKALAETPAPASQDLPEEVWRGSETVLLVEDEPAVRALLAQMLKGAGYRVLSAGSGPEAVELATNRHRNTERATTDSAASIDLLLTDLVMPGGLSGRETAETLQSRLPGLRVIYMTGYTDDTVLRQGQWLSEPALLHKPFGKAELLRLVRHTLDH